MIKLITPPGLLLTTAMLAIYAGYAFLISAVEDSVLLFIGGSLSVVGAVGAATMKPWSRYLVYVLSVGAAVKLSSSVNAAVEAGYFSFQFDSKAQRILALAPELALVVLGFLCCALVWHQFKARDR